MMLHKGQMDYVDRIRVRLHLSNSSHMLPIPEFCLVYSLHITNLTFLD